LNKLEQTIAHIQLPNEATRRAASDYLDTLTKPPGSLGKLEELAIQLAGITEELPLEIMRKAIIVMAGDHGVCEEGISAYPQEVTPQMVMNFLHGGAAINVLARQAGADVICVDIGVKSDLKHENLFDRKVRAGTGNIARGAAMSRDEALLAITHGIEMVEELVAKGYQLFATGEMGIGNTTPSAAMFTVLAGIDMEQAVGRGTGIDDTAMRKKKETIKRAIVINAPDPADPLDVLSKLGGLEIAGLTGVILGCAALRCPIVIDGFIASIAALTAARLAPQSLAYMIPSHVSQEAGHRLLLEQLDLEPMIDMKMRLGEGSGAALCFHLIDAAVLIMREMSTFDRAGVSRT
jgi:nicotinate-nucleotide--dimethylbenzimidazole phosphoribosyltransferase